MIIYNIAVSLTNLSILLDGYYYNSLSYLWEVKLESIVLDIIFKLKRFK